LYIKNIISNFHTYHFSAGLLPIHESLWDYIGRQQLIALLELLEKNTIGETLATDTDSLKYTVASQLVEYQAGVNLTGLKTVGIIVCFRNTAD